MGNDKDEPTMELIDNVKALNDAVCLLIDGMKHITNEIERIESKLKEIERKI